MILLQRRIDNLRNDAHIKIATFIAKKYDHFLISKYQVSKMVEKENRNLNKRGTKDMLLMAHYSFRQILKKRAQLFGCVIHEVGEHYSSKSCGNCLVLDRKLGNKRTYHCPHCHFTIPRDFNGSRDIFIMNVEKCVGKIHPIAFQDGLGATPQ